MKVFHHPDCALHAPSLFYRRGALVGHPEQAVRADVMFKACRKAGHEMRAVAEPETLPVSADAPRAVASEDLAALMRVHDAGYLGFLSEAWACRGELPGAPDAIVATHFARPRMHRTPTALLGRVGRYMADTSTPILAGTWAAALGAALTALEAARAVLRGERAAYALCRPPGHHAYADSAGGFCYLNNAAVAAAEIAARTRGPVATLDLDVHAGNGTQGVFYERADVTTVSVHVDPNVYYPFHAGYADETGAGAGRGACLNLPLPLGAGEEAWLAAIAEGLRRVQASGSPVVVVSLGLDASEDDPLQGMRVTTRGFARAGRMVAETGRRVVIVQEGGYLRPSLGDDLTAFLSGFET